MPHQFISNHFKRSAGFLQINNKYLKIDFQNFKEAIKLLKVKNYFWQYKSSPKSTRQPSTMFVKSLMRLAFRNDYRKISSA